MNFWQRLRFYLIGFIPGCIILFYIINKKGCTSPNELKMKELIYQHFEMSHKAACKLKCLKLTNTGFKIELQGYQVNYDLSDVHAKPCGSYFIEGKDKSKAAFELVIRDCDTITKIDDIRILDPKITCHCDTVKD